MTIRDATRDDLDLLMSLVDRLEAELPELPYPDDPPEVERGKVERMISDGVALIAEADGDAVGYALARYGDHGPATVFVTDLWVDRGWRGQGIGHELLRRVGRDALERGSTHLLLDVDPRNREAITFYDRLGFEEDARILRVGVERFLREPEQVGESFGALHVQSDDAPTVERRVNEYLPRVRRGTSAQVEHGHAWTTVRIEPFDRDVLRRLGQELSHRFGVTVLLAVEEGAVVRFVFHDRGRMVDEYLSVPEYYGPLPPGNAAALRANPTVVSRLTGSQPARIRAATPNADRPGDLPPAEDLYVQLADALGLQP
jgi:ribosomal protein S18 acetylase RimI-like enzyme